MRRAAHAARRRDEIYHWVTLALAAVLVPIAGSRHAACQWALTVRFPKEDLGGLTPATRAAFEAARTRALWEHRELLGLTSEHRSAHDQARLFAEEVRRAGSAVAARRRVLPPERSRHVAGTALDVRPAEGARWLEQYGAEHGLYRTYDNEWWHFEYHPHSRPPRLPYPGANPFPAVRGRSGQDGGLPVVRGTTYPHHPISARATWSAWWGICPDRESGGAGVDGDPAGCFRGSNVGMGQGRKISVFESVEHAPQPMTTL